MTIEPVAYIYNDYSEKFGIPRQSGLANELSEIRLTGIYAVPEALRGIESYDHLWLLWLFSENTEARFSPTVRPPRLGGNTRMGVFATRSPFRPNHIGLSCVQLIEVHADECRLIVSGADIKNGTPIIDIKPYIPYTDIKENAVGGFSDSVIEKKKVIYSDDPSKHLDTQQITVLTEILAQDPRPQYHEDGREYTFTYAGHEVSFTVDDDIVTAWIQG